VFVCCVELRFVCVLCGVKVCLCAWLLGCCGTGKCSVRKYTVDILPFVCVQVYSNVLWDSEM
jgi:hypothetical protein